MNDALQQISLLYELSIINIKSLRPEDVAKAFVEKLLLRKSLNSGAVWIFENVSNGKIICKSLYAMPDIGEERYLSLDTIPRFFGEGSPVVTSRSIFDEGQERKHAYFKLNDIGFLELCSGESPDKINRELLHPLRDVVSQLAVSLETGFTHQKLQKEIRNRKEAERSLRNTQEKYAGIINNIRLGLLEVDNDEVIQYANKSFLNLTGYRPEEVLGRKASELFMDHPEAPTTHEQQGKRWLEGVSDCYELPIRDKAGNRKWTIVSGAPNYDSQGNLIGAIGIHLDITAQKKLAGEHQFKVMQVRKLFEMSLDALVSVDGEGRIIEWSPQAEEVFGYSVSEAIGMSLAENIIPSTHLESYKRGIGNVLRTGEEPTFKTRVEITALRKSGEEFPAEVTIFPLEYKKKWLYTAFVRDITELKTSRENMERALARQKELNDLKSQFISMTSHELRTPLTTIRSNTELLNHRLEHEEHLDVEQLKKNVSRIEYNIHRLNQLVSNILLIGKLDANHIPFQPTMTDPVAYAEEKILPNISADERQIILKQQGEPFELQIDRYLFRHIINNLLENALKYSIGKAAPELILNFRETALLIEVKDHGIGISEENWESLFDTFYRGSNVGNIQGSGLGLTIVKRFVNVHGGTISVKSKPGKGSTFSVLFKK